MASMAEDQDPFRSSRLVYRAIEPTDHESFFYELMSDSIAQRNSAADIRPVRRKDVLEFLKYVDEKTVLGVVVFLRVDGEAGGDGGGFLGEGKEGNGKGEEKEKEKLIPIGQIHMTSSQGPNGIPSRHGQIGVDILKGYRGMGYGTEAIKWITTWAFMYAGLHRVGIGCFSFNEGARRLYEKMGFVFEGIRREYIFMNGAFHDIIEFALLDREWKDLSEKGLW